MADRGRPQVGRTIEVRLSDEVVGWLDIEVARINVARTVTGCTKPIMRMTRAQLIRSLLEQRMRSRTE